MLSKSTATQLLIIKKGKSKHVNKHPVITYSINEKKTTSVQKLNKYQWVASWGLLSAHILLPGCI